MSSFAFIQTNWNRGAQKLESPLESMNQSRDVTGAEGAGIKCWFSEPRTCSWAFNFCFLCKDNGCDVSFPLKGSCSAVLLVAVLEKDAIWRDATADHRPHNLSGW